ncbi:MAG: flippase [Nanoarchaeota archaeon]
MDKNNNKDLNKSLKMLARGSLIVLIGVLISKILTYLYKIVIARTFGPEIFGVFSLSLTVFSIFITLGSLGLSEGLLRYIALYKGIGGSKVKHLIKFSIIISLFSGLIGATILFIFAETISVNLFNSYNMTLFLKVFSIAIPISILSNIFLSILKAYEKVTLYTFIVNIFSNGIKVLLLIIFILVGLKENAILSSYFISILGVAILSYIGCKKVLVRLLYEKDIASNEKKRLNREFFSYSWPILFLGAINILFYWIDSFVIGYFKTATDVGFYNVSFTLVALFGIAPELFMQLFFPIIVREYSKKRIEMIRELSKQVVKWIFILNLPLLIIMFIFPGAVINILFGQEFLAAESSLRILAVAGAFSSFSTLMNNLLSMKGKSKTILMNIIVTSIINLVLNIILVPSYGIVGAAIGTSISWIILNLMLFVEVKRQVSIIPLRRKMLKIAIASIIPTILLTVIKYYISVNLFTLIILTLLFVFLYLVLIFKMGCLDKNDLEILNNIRSYVYKNILYKNHPLRVNDEISH